MSAAIKVLFATRTSPFPGESGSGTYVFDLLRYLSQQGFCIQVVWTEPPDLLPTHGLYRAPTVAAGVFTLQIPDTLRLGRRFWRPSVVWLPLKARSSYFVKTVLKRLRLWREKQRLAQSVTSAPGDRSSSVPSWGAACTPAECAAVCQAALQFNPDIVIANYAWMTPAAVSTGKPTVVLAHDVRHRQLHLTDGAVVEKYGEFMSLESERESLAGAQAIVAIQQVEASVFKKLFPGKKVVSAPMSVSPSPIPIPATTALLFVGSRHRANLEGLRWFIEEVFPLVRSADPSVRLRVAGSICDGMKPCDGIEILGRMSDLSLAYAGASVVIAPILKGSGVKIKILEAMVYRRACITTSVGAEGLEEFRPTLRVCDTPESFASAAIDLLRSPEKANALGTALAALANDRLTPAVCYGPVADLVRNLSST